MTRKAIIIGNSDGIGLELTKSLLKTGWEIYGISRSPSDIVQEGYSHKTINVKSEEYTSELEEITGKDKEIELAVYCAGIGEPLDLSDMKNEQEVFEVNLMGMVKAARVVIPYFVKKGAGHLMGLSSLADDMLSEEAPGYHASKAGFSNYLEGLALACRKHGVHVTNIRFGFVDTKMAKGDIKPFMMSVQKAAAHIIKCMDKKPIRYTAPKIVVPIVKFRRFMLNLEVLRRS
ncbi:MAG: SDR family NAD(P)-dependent oxidoreductase [Elusimicrobia bacterium]|nr:SDR family NAD(P)-dependent oxidoreductase [Elusimicrobiota bacterium]